MKFDITRTSTSSLNFVALRERPSLPLSLCLKLGINWRLAVMLKILKMHNLPGADNNVHFCKEIEYTYLTFENSICSVD